MIDPKAADPKVAETMIFLMCQKWVDLFLSSQPTSSGVAPASSRTPLEQAVQTVVVGQPQTFLAIIEQTQKLVDTLLKAVWYHNAVFVFPSSSERDGARGQFDSLKYSLDQLRKTIRNAEFNCTP